MPFLSAPFVVAKIAENRAERASEKDGHISSEPEGSWRPVTSNGVLWNKDAVHAPEDEEKELWRGRRDAHASAARARYSEWQVKQPPSTAASRRERPLESSFWRHSFREREQSKELGKNWASGSQVGRRSRVC